MTSYRPLELYEREFINSLTSYNHPYKNFGMQSEVSKEADYISTLIDPLAVQDVVYTTSIENELKQDPATPKEEADQGYVVLDDAVELKGLIAQFGNTGVTKPKE